MGDEDRGGSGRQGRGKGASRVDTEEGVYPVLGLAGDDDDFDDEEE